MGEYVKFWLAQKVAGVVFPLAVGALLVVLLVLLVLLVAAGGCVSDWLDRRRAVRPEHGGR